MLKAVRLFLRNIFSRGRLLKAIRANDISEIERTLSESHEFEKDASREIVNRVIITYAISSHGNYATTGATPLIAAIKHSTAEIAELILSRGADPNGYCYSKLPLYFAIIGKRIDLAKLLIDRGADVNLLVREDDLITRHPYKLDRDHSERVGQPLIEFAIRGNDLEMVKLILSKGATLNEIRVPWMNWSEIKQYPLSIAVAEGHEQITRILAASGAQPRTFEELVALDDIDKQWIHRNTDPSLSTLFITVLDRAWFQSKKNEWHEDKKCAKAAELAGRLKEVNAVKPLTKLLDHWPVGASQHAATALTAIGRPAIKHLVVLLALTESCARSAAAEIIKKIDSRYLDLPEAKEAIPSLAACYIKGYIGHTRYSKEEAESILLRIDPYWYKSKQSGAAAFENLFRDSLEHGSQHDIEKILGRLDREFAIRSLLEALENFSRYRQRYRSSIYAYIIELLKRVDEGWAHGEAVRELMPWLIEQLFSNKRLDFLVAVTNEVKDRRAIEPIIGLAVQGGSNSSVVETLKAIDIGLSVEILTTYIDDSDSGAVAACLLGELGDARCAPSLVALIDTAPVSHWPARSNAVEALAKLKALDAVDSIIGFIEKSRDLEAEWSVQEKAIFALGRTADSRAVEPLIGIIDYRNCATIAQALYMIEKDWCKRASARQLITRLAENYESGHVSTFLDEMDSDWTKTGEAQAAAQSFIKAFKKGHKTSVSLARVLGRIGDPRALSALTTASETVSRTAISAIRSILESSASIAAEGHLRVVASLQNVVHITVSDGCPVTRTAQPVDVSVIKQLARQELIRRGHDA